MTSATAAAQKCILRNRVRGEGWVHEEQGGCTVPQAFQLVLCTPMYSQKQPRYIYLQTKRAGPEKKFYTGVVAYVPRALVYGKRKVNTVLSSTKTLLPGPGQRGHTERKK